MQIAMYHYHMYVKVAYDNFNNKRRYDDDDDDCVTLPAVYVTNKKCCLCLN